MKISKEIKYFKSCLKVANNSSSLTNYLVYLESPIFFIYNISNWQLGWFKSTLLQFTGIRLVSQLPKDGAVINTLQSQQITTVKEVKH